jgi:hypothetical protein
MGILKRSYVGKLERNDILHKFFEIFNNLFFYGSLKDYVKVEFQPPWDVNQEIDGYCVSSSIYFEPQDAIPDNFAALIVLKDYSGDGHYRNRNSRMEFYLGTLLHEMLHAYFGIYLCQCSTSCRNSATMTTMGNSGHCTLWLKSAYAIEQATVSLLGEGLDLGLEGSVIDEYGNGYRDTAPRNLLLTLGLLERQGG